MSEQNVAVVKRWFEEVWNQRNANVIDELLTEESVCHDGNRQLRGPAGFKEHQFEPLLSAIPDLKVEVEAAMAQDEQVVVRWRATGTHDGPGLGFPATGEPIDLRGMSWIEIRDGHFQSGWQYSNMPEVLEHLRTVANVS